jgi:hypothetical protein
MLKKLLVMFILVFGLIQVGFSICEFELDEDNTCKRYYGGFEDLTLEISGEVDVKSSSLEVYQNDIPRFEFLHTQENINTFSLDNALSHSGVYTLIGETNNRFGDQSAYSEEEIIIDLYQPLPPSIDLILESSLVEGTGDHAGDRVFAYAADGAELSSTTVGEDGAFSFNLGLLSPAYVSFVVESLNGLKSEPLERHVYVRERGQYIYDTVSSISFDIGTMNTVNSVLAGKTNKRNFYVSGGATAPDGTLVYVNGQRVQIQDNSFGAFVELNTGVNTIEVRSNYGIIGATFSIEYVETFFSFEELLIQKVFENTFSLSGKVTTPNPFLLFVNGEFISEVGIQNDNTFDFIATNVKGDKLLVELYGEDNTYESIVVYRDIESPSVISHNFQKIGIPSFLLFEISDDVGIDYSSISLELNSGKYLDYSQRFGEFIAFDISNLTQGNYNYELSGTDLYSRPLEGETEGSFSVSTTLDFDLVSTSGSVKTFGSKIFSASESISLNLLTTGPIAFKHMYVDGVEHIDYSIESSSVVTVNNLKLQDTNGMVLFEYVDGQGVQYSKTFDYVVDMDKTQLNIDSITNYARPISDEVGSYVRITGEISDPHFDWNLFYINGINPTFTSNFYFEALVKVDDLNLLFSGSDILGNGFSQSKISSLFEQDGTTSEVIFEGGENSIFGYLQSTFNGNEELVILENSKFKRTHFEDQFDISSEQREGLQYLEILSRNQFSHNDYSSPFITIFDQTTPQVSVSEEDGFLLIDVDPTFGEIISSVLISSGELVSSVSCESQFFKGECLKVGVGTYVLSVEDSYGNILESEIGPGVSLGYPQFNAIYFQGTDTEVTQKVVFVQGAVVSDESIEKVLIDGNDLCDFDGVNFICLGEASIGENIFAIELINSEDTSIYEEEVNITRPGENPLDLDVDFISGVYDFGNRMYYFGEPISTSISSNQDAILSYYINGEKIIYGQINAGDTTLNLNLNTYIEGRDSASIDLAFKVENNDVRETSIFTLFYDKTKELILEILIN